MIKITIRITDMVFFGTIFTTLGCVLLFAFLGLGIPEWLKFWWVILLPIAVSKQIFPRSRFTKWLEKEHNYSIRK